MIFSAERYSVHAISYIRFNPLVGQLSIRLKINEASQCYLLALEMQCHAYEKRAM